jgi:hypothetical protein
MSISRALCIGLWEAHEFVINVLRMEELKVVKYYNRDEEAIIVCNSVIFD